MLSVSCFLWCVDEDNDYSNDDNDDAENSCCLMLQVVCSHLSEADLTDIDLLQQLHDAVNVYYNYTGSTPCFSINQTAVSSLQDMGWDFQVCA